MYNRSGIFFYYPISLFNQDKPFTLIDIKYFEKNENISKGFIKTFYHFTNGKHRISINWIIKEVKSLFPLKKRRFIQPAKCVMYQVLVMRTILVNQNVKWQLDGKNIILLPKILNLQNIYTKTANVVTNLGKCFSAYQNNKEPRSDVRSFIMAQFK